MIHGHGDRPADRGEHPAHGAVVTIGGMITSLSRRIAKLSGNAYARVVAQDRSLDRGHVLRQGVRADRGRARGGPDPRDQGADAAP
ncbi:hypothetical protein QJS66_05400 [Kocuria rhizophila]|nr:hypothetical protein QJS66_05400 [Kocuria rhizophila]